MAKLPKSHKSPEELLFEQAQARTKVKKFSQWKHLKSGNIYQVVLVAMDEESLEPAVCYFRYDETDNELDYICWSRPLPSWLEKFQEVKEG